MRTARLLSAPAPLLFPSVGLAGWSGDGRGGRAAGVRRSCRIWCRARSRAALGAFGLVQLSRSFSLLLASSGTRRPAIFSIRSSWWRTKKSFGSGDGFVNKLDGASFCSSLARPGRHGGGRRADLPGSEAPWEDGEAASAFLPRSSSPAVPTWLLPSSRCIHWPFERLLHKLVLTTVSRLGFLFLPADMPKGRIFGPGMASHACLVPSGVVPGDDAGGHARISQRKDGGEGLDCNLYLPLWVLFIKSEDYVMFFVYPEVLFVKCNPTALK